MNRFRKARATGTNRDCRRRFIAGSTFGALNVSVLVRVGTVLQNFDFGLKLRGRG